MRYKSESKAFPFTFLFVFNSKIYPLILLFDPYTAQMLLPASSLKCRTDILNQIFEVRKSDPRDI